MSISKMFAEKRQYRRLRTRMGDLPSPYQESARALERYLTYHGAISRGDVLVRMLGDLVDLFEQSAASQTPVRDIVGPDPVEFAEAFLQNYADGQWINTERARLIRAIDAADSAQPPTDDQE